MNPVAASSQFGLYVHVPFCRSLCPYCDFNSHVRHDPPWRELRCAWLGEFDARLGLFEGEAISSVYFGGGTPSLTPPAELADLLEEIGRRRSVAVNAEITLEANPGSTDVDALRVLRGVGVNRISLGWQSTHDRLLKVLGRGHSAADSRRAYDDARRAGFDNLSVDLIFAVPGQTLEDLVQDLGALVDLQPEHVSLYALTYHAGTEFGRRLSDGRMPAIDDELEVAMMDRIDDVLGAAGYDHYEVSNYARTGRRASHNSLYWTGGSYLGLGPGAHSFVHRDWQEGWRWEAVVDPTVYLDAWSGPVAKGLPVDGDGSTTFVERLDARQLLAERMLCGLRMAEGIDMGSLTLGSYADEVKRAIGVAGERGWATVRGSRLVPTREGLRHADALAALFF